MLFCFLGKRFLFAYPGWVTFKFQFYKFSAWQIFRNAGI